MKSFISAIGTANPKYKYSQEEICQFMIDAYPSLNGQESKLRALYRATGIKNRYSVIPDYSKNNGDYEFYPNTTNLEPFPDTASRMKLFQKEAVHLGNEAIQNCISKIPDTKLSEITHLITVSCTGFYAPGLDIDLVNLLNLNPGIHRTAINYMGCYAAISALRIGHSIASADKDAKVLILCLELCSLHYQKLETDDNKLANSLFGDGAAAVIISGTQLSELSLTPILFDSKLISDGKSEMAWVVGNLGFEMKLSSYVPEVLKQGLDSFEEELFKRSNAKSIDHFAIHPGGKKILESVEEKLNLEKHQLQYSYDVLRNYGNMSSPTILFVLKDIMKNLNSKNDQDLVLTMAFGPGITLESSLLQVTTNG